MQGKIFISYRRSDSLSPAGRLRDRLADVFGTKNVFMDVESIPSGGNFIKYLEDQASSCDVFLAVIGSSWLDARDDAGTRRLDNADDFVVKEIAAALPRDIPVIPVLLDGTSMPSIHMLPESLKPLTHRQAVKISQEDFTRDTNAVIAKIQEALSAERSKAQKAAVTAAAEKALTAARRGGRAAKSAALLGRDVAKARVPIWWILATVFAVALIVAVAARNGANDSPSPSPIPGNASTEDNASSSPDNTSTEEGSSEK